jgi:hypothetical protein
MLSVGALRVWKERTKEQQIINRLALSLALFALPTEELIELFKLTKDKKHLVCQ